MCYCIYTYYIINNLPISCQFYVLDANTGRVTERSDCVKGQEVKITTRDSLPALEFVTSFSVPYFLPLSHWVCFQHMD